MRKMCALFLAVSCFAAPAAYTQEVLIESEDSIATNEGETSDNPSLLYECGCNKGKGKGNGKNK